MGLVHLLDRSGRSSIAPLIRSLARRCVTTTRGTSRASARRVGGLLALSLLLTAAVSGCQVPQAGIGTRIFTQRSLIDFSGLNPVETFASLKTTGAIPQNWSPLPLKKTPLYTHEQWRSPTIVTGVGVAYIHLPIPLPASAILWFAKREYTKREDDGRAIGEWTDAQGRQWFEAENNKFHVRGYAVTRGLDAWIVYCGYRRAHPPPPSEISLAARSAETMIPGGAADAGSIR